MNEIWVLGATGRSGRAIAALLAAQGREPVLVGRDAGRLRAVADVVGGGARTLVAESVDSVAQEIAERGPAVVVNTIGPFSQTALRLVDACPPGTHYLDLTNDVFTVNALLALDKRHSGEGSCVVAGAGFGVLGTESVVLRLCEGRPAAQRVRVAAVPAVAVEGGVVGTALAASLIEALPAGGRRYAGGRLVRARLGGNAEQLTLPDGSAVTTVAFPAGELESARRASGAPSVVATTSELPSGRLLRAALPVAGTVLSVPPLRRAVQRRLASTPIAPRPRKRHRTWAHARVHWADGTVREGWLSTGDASDFTAAVSAEVATRLARGEGKPGAHTPGALFGPGLAEAAGARFELS